MHTYFYTGPCPDMGSALAPWLPRALPAWLGPVDCNRTLVPAAGGCRPKCAEAAAAANMGGQVRGCIVDRQQENNLDKTFGKYMFYRNQHLAKVRL